MISARLTPDEMVFVEWMADLWTASAIANGQTPRWGQFADPESRRVANRLGVAGELAFAKYRNIYYMPPIRPQHRGEGDVGDWQVRARSEAWHDLILHPDDDDNARHALVVGMPPDMFVVGWCYGRAGKLDGYWADPAGGRPAFFVPQSVLIPFQDSSPAGINADGFTGVGGEVELPVGSQSMTTPAGDELMDEMAEYAAEFMADLYDPDDPTRPFE